MAMIAYIHGYGFGANWLLLVGVPLLLGLWAQFRVKKAFRTWGEVRASSNITGAEAAREILAAAKIHDVSVVETNDFLGDHYDPTNKRLCLSTNVFHTSSVAALGIAAHETGHAIQHAAAYAPLKARMAVVPATMLVSRVLPFVMFAGLFFHLLPWAITLNVVIIGYLVITIFQLITLPVEFDASRRAKIILGEMGMVRAGEEAAGVNKVLDAAAWTYVAALVAAIGNLLYFLSLRGRD
jgi:Zn-dependent membrane protease YugP